MPVRALGAIKKVAIFILFGLGGRGVGVWVGDFGGAAVGAGADGVVPRDEGGEGGGGEDVAVGEKGGVWGQWALEDGGRGLGGREYPYSFGRVRMRDMVVVEVRVLFCYLFMKGMCREVGLRFERDWWE